MGTGTVEVPVPGICYFFWWYQNRYRKNLVPKKVQEPVSKQIWYRKSLRISIEKICYRNKSRNRSRKNLVPEKVLEPVLEKFGTRINFCRQNLEM